MIDGVTFIFKCFLLKIFVLDVILPTLYFYLDFWLKMYKCGSLIFCSTITTVQSCMLHTSTVEAIFFCFQFGYENPVLFAEKALIPALSHFFGTSKIRHFS